MSAETCQCSTFYNVAIPEHRNHPCARVIEKKHVLCRPCALNWHDEPCDTYYREPVFHITKTCARCGHDAALHEPRDEGEPAHTWEELVGGIREDRDRVRGSEGTHPHLVPDAEPRPAAPGDEGAGEEEGPVPAEVHAEEPPMTDREKINAIFGLDG